MDDIKIIEEKQNPLFKRREVKLSVVGDVIPSKDEVDKFLSEKYKSDPSKIRIKKIDSKFGSKEFIIEANIYDSEEEMFATERFSKKEKEKIKKIQEEKNKPAEPEKKEEAPAEEKPTEKKKEEVKQ